MRKLLHEELLGRQKERMRQGFIPLTVILNNVRSLYNVGSIFRTADGAGVEKIWLCGITGCPPNNQISKTALGAEERVVWEHAEDPLEIIKQYKDKSYEIVLLEQLEESQEYSSYTPERPICLVLGHEVTGVDPKILSLCDRAIEIEMAGLKNSLNVSVAFGIIAYHLRQHLKIFSLLPEKKIG